jgi:uncharacterized repeat protein (TIGR01451 family)
MIINQKHMSAKNSVFSKVFMAVLFAGLLFTFAKATPLLADSVNLMPNPAFAPDPANVAIPLDWKFSTYGTNTAVSGYPVVGPTTDSIGVETTVSSYTDGFADWFTNTVPATAFATYTYTDSYKSDASGIIEAQFVVQDVETGALSNIYTDIGFTASTGGAWATSTAMFIAPAGTVQMSVFHVINNTGSLAIVNPSLVKTADPATFSQGMVTLTFDDGNQSNFDTAYPILNAAGLKGSFYIISQSMKDAATIGTSTGDINDDYMTAAEIMQINRDGHEIGNHTVNHCNLITGLCPDAEIANSTDPLSPVQEITQAGADLASIGALPVDTFAYPYGEYNASLESALAGAGIIGARTVDRGYNLTTSNPYALKIQYVTASSTTAADFEANIKPWIDTARQNNVWLILLFHQVEPASVIAANPYDPDVTTPEVLQATVDYLKQNNVKVVTMHDGVCMMSGMSGNPECSKNTVPAPLVTLSTSTPATGVVGQAYTATVFATSTNKSDALSWNISGTPSWMNVATTTDSLVLSGVPDATSTSQISISVTGADIRGAAALADYSLMIEAANSTTTPANPGTGTTTPSCVSNCNNGGNGGNNHGHDGDDGHGGNGNSGNHDGDDSHNNNNHGGNNGGHDGDSSHGNGGHDGSNNGNGHTSHNDECGCFDLNTLATSTKVAFGTSWDGAQYSLQNILNNLGFSVNTAHDQANIQSWTPTSDTTTLTVKALSRNSAYDSVFGYFQGGTFHPIYKTGIISGYESTPLWFAGTSRDVTITGKGAVTFAIYVPNTNTFRYTDNSLNDPKDYFAVSYDISDKHADSFIIAFEDLANVPAGSSDHDYNDNVTLVTVKDCSDNVANHPPVITLLGANPATVNVGETYLDPGATAFDQEDGDITNKIVASSTVNTAVVGSYTVTYNVKDSQGLAATPVTRTVNVINPNGSGPTTGNVNFCVMFADGNNALATSSSLLPNGIFSINLATSTGIGSSTVQTASWNTNAFAPDRKIISSTNDADCVTYANLPLGTYYYSELGVSYTANVGSTTVAWSTPKYNDQYSQPVNNVFDFFPYSPELFNATTTDDASRNFNSDGQLVLDATNRDLTLVMYVTFSTSTATTTPPGCTTNCGGGGSGSSGANISVSKTADKTTANVGDTITYTLTVSNAGPLTATGINLSDMLPSTLTFVSATSSVGAYSTTTGMWNVGDLLNGSSTALTLVATINAGTEGKVISNTAIASSTVSDPDNTDNTSTADVTVNTPNTGCTSNCGGGGGGGNPPACTANCGGNGPIVGSYGGGGPVATSTPIAPAACYYLYDYLKAGWNNNPVEVKKLQVFLRDLEGYDVQITGIYDDQTIAALDAFQNKYKDDILTPWGHTAPTGFTYILTKKKVNEIYCNMAFPVTPQQQEEIDTFRAFLLGLQDNGVAVPTGPSEGNTNSHPSTGGEVGVAPGNEGAIGGNKPTTTPSKWNLSTLAGISSTTQKFANDLTANVLSAGKKVWDGFLSALAWPLSLLNKPEASNICSASSKLLGGINLLLIIIILVMAYLWYRQYRNNKDIEDLNKEIDLK